jgi:hypothetical protein
VERGRVTASTPKEIQVKIGKYTDKNLGTRFYIVRNYIDQFGRKCCEYLHHDGVWWESTQVKSGWTGYYDTEEEAYQTAAKYGCVTK